MSQVRDSCVVVAVCRQRGAYLSTGFDLDEGAESVSAWSLFKEAWSVEEGCLEMGLKWVDGQLHTAPHSILDSPD